MGITPGKAAKLLRKWAANVRGSLASSIRLRNRRAGSPAKPRHGLMAPSKADRRLDPALFVLLPIAAGLRLRGLSRESLWLDEINQLMTASHPLTEMGAEIRWHASPPLDYVVTHFWQLVAWSDTSIRIPAVIWSVASVALLYLAVRHLGYESAALSAGALLTLSLPSIAYAQEARMYSLFVFATTAVLYSMGRLLKEPEARRGWVLLAVSAIVVIYTHYYAALLLVSLTLPVLTICAARRSKRILGNALATGFAVAVSFIPWLPSLLQQTRIHQGSLQYALPRDLYFEVMPSYLAGGLEGTWVWVLGGIFLFGLFLATVRSPEVGLTLAAFSIIPFLLVYAIPFFSRTITPRNLLFLLPGYYAGIAVGLAVPLGFLLGRFRPRRAPRNPRGTPDARDIRHARDTADTPDARHARDTQGASGAVGAHETLPAGRTMIHAVAGLVLVLIVAVWPTYGMLATYHETGWRLKTDNADWRDAAEYLDARVGPNDVIVTNDPYTRYLLSFYLDREALQGKSLDPYVQSPYHAVARNDERYRVWTFGAPPSLLRRAVEGARNAWFVVPAPALEKLVGIAGRARRPVAEGFDLPIVHLSEPHTVDSLVLSRPPGPPSPEVATGELNLVTGEGWSAQFFLQDGVFTRHMGPHGSLRLPVWSPHGTTAHLRLFVPEAWAETTLQLRAGDHRTSQPLVSGWQDVSLDLAVLPDERGWVTLQLSATAPPDRPGESMEIGETGAVSPVSILAESSTHEAAGFADIFVDGELYSWFAAAKGYGRGYNLVAVDPLSGDVVDWAVFDTHDDPGAARALETFIDGLATGTIVAGAVKDDGSTLLSAAAYRALGHLGCSLDIRGRFRAAHAFVGVKGAAPGSAVEDGLTFQGRVAVGADMRGLSIGLASVEISDRR